MKLMREFKRNAALRYVMRNILMTLAHIDHEY